MKALLINKKEINRLLTEDKFLEAHRNAKFVIDVQDKNVFTLEKSILTIGEINYTLDITFVFRRMNLYIIEFWIPNINNVSDSEFVKSEYLKLKENLLSLDNEMLTNKGLQIVGLSSIENIHLVVYLD